MIRPATPADSAAMLACWNASSRFDALSPELFHENVWADPDLAGGAPFVDIRDDGLAGFGVAVVRGERGVIKMYAVARPWWRQGIGTALVDALEDAMRAAGATSVRLGECAPNYLTPGLDVRYEAAGAFFRRRGYRKIGMTMNLEVGLPDHPMSSLEAGTMTSARGASFHVWRASSDDRDRVLHLIDRHWPAWRGEIERALANHPLSLHVAQPDSVAELVAFAAYDANNHGTGWFGPMGTAPEWEGHGLGRALLLRCLEDIRQQGHPKAIIPWVGPVGFYHDAAGAQVSRVFMRMEKAL